MKKQLLLFTPSLIFLCAAVFTMLLLPARIGWNTGASDLSSTEQRALTLAGYYYFAEPQKEAGTLHIGTKPYDNFYMRTYALELWVVGGVLLLAELALLNRRRKLAS